jgi:protein TonB
MKHPFGIALTFSVGAHIVLGAGACFLPTFDRPTSDPEWGATQVVMGRFPPLDARRTPPSPPPAPPDDPAPPDVPDEWLTLPPVPPPPRAIPQPPPLESFHAIPVPRAAVSSPVVLDNPPPEYPETARRHGLQGRVVLLVRVSTGGEPTSVSILESSGHPILDEAARGGVRMWSFRPATKGGRAVEGEVEVPVRFRLEGPSR